MKPGRLYWPVSWSISDDTDGHLAFIDNWELARIVVNLFEAAGMTASLNPPVRLGIHETFVGFPE